MKNSLQLIRQQKPLRHKGVNPRSKRAVSWPWPLTQKAQRSGRHLPQEKPYPGFCKGAGEAGWTGKESQCPLPRARPHIHSSIIYLSRTCCTPSAVTMQGGPSATWDGLGSFPRARAEIFHGPMCLCLDHLGWLWILPHVSPWEFFSLPLFLTSTIKTTSGQDLWTYSFSICKQA